VPLYTSSNDVRCGCRIGARYIFVQLQQPPGDAPSRAGHRPASCLNVISECRAPLRRSRRKLQQLLLHRTRGRRPVEVLIGRNRRLKGRINFTNGLHGVLRFGG
jgi:hypothetical protein